MQWLLASNLQHHHCPLLRDDDVNDDDGDDDNHEDDDDGNLPAWPPSGTLLSSTPSHVLMPS